MILFCLLIKIDYKFKFTIIWQTFEELSFFESVIQNQLELLAP